MSIPAKTVSRTSALLGRLAALPARLVGPIFTKELRVSSRRRRNFVLRAVYLAVLTAFVALVWFGAMQWSRYGSQAYRISHMEQAGKQIIVPVVWFQFCAMQLITVIMLSTSISEEVYHRTLGVLMTTPINSLQVVLGKLLSKMLQLVLLLAMSLPMLAIVRVLGGVPWQFILAGVVITLTTSLFFAAVTMFFSIIFRRAFVSILLALGALLVLYGGIPLIVALAADALDLDRPPVVRALLWVLVHYNPYGAMVVCTEAIFNPRAVAGGFLGFGFAWWGCCVCSLGLAAGVLAICVAMVRRVGLRMVAGETGAGPSSAAAIPATAAPPPKPVLQPAGPAAEGPPAPPPVVRPTAAVPPARGRIRSIVGSPILWRELRARWMRRRWLFWLLLGIGLWVLLMIYGLLGIDNELDDDDVHAVFLCLYTLAGAVAVAVLSATNITSEKEARSWQILLCTPMGNWHILAGKAVGVLRRCLPVWLLPMGHVLLFIVVGYCHPVLAPHMLLVLFSVTALFTGSGLYFGARFKRTTTAVILNLALGLTLWLAVPAFLALAAEAVPRGDLRSRLRHAAEWTLDANPVFQAGFLSERASGKYRANKSLGSFTYHWPGLESANVYETTAYLMAHATGYLVLGAAFAWLAKRRIRRKVF